MQQGQVQLPMVPADSEEANQYADLISLKIDLMSALVSIEDLISLKASLASEEIDKFSEALWVSGLIQYYRCFASGRRKKLDETIFTNKVFSDDALKEHQTIVEVRNQHLAHRVNDYQQVKVSLVLQHPA